MNTLSFAISDIAPKEVYFTNTSFTGDNPLHLITKNIVDALEKTDREDDENKDLTDTEFVAKVMDSYFNTTKTDDVNVITDLSSRLSGHMSDILIDLNQVSTKEITPLFNKIQSVTKDYFTKANGNTDPNGKAKRKFTLLDLNYMFSIYKADASSYAQELCQKYDFNISNLDTRNIIPFINSFESITDIRSDENNKVMRAILEDIDISISSDSNNVTVDTNAPDSVDVSKNGENVPSEDGDSTTTHPEDDDVNTSDNSDININDDEDNAKISITINGEEQEVAKMMVKACFDKTAFEQLKYKVFRGDFNSTLDASALTTCIQFVARPIEDMMDRHTKGKLTTSLSYMLKENIEVIKDYQKAAILVLDLASKYYKDKLILGSNLLNKNAVDELAKKGVDVYTLANDYLRVNHNDNKDDILYANCGHSAVPKDGVSIETLVLTRGTVEKYLGEYTSLLKNANSEMYQKANKRAIESVLFDFAEKKTDDYTKYNGDLHPTQYKRLVMSDVLTLADEYSRNSNDNLEDMLMSFYLNNFKDKEVRETYNRIAFKTASMEDGNASLVFAKTIVDSIAEYLVAATVD